MALTICESCKDIHYDETSIFQTNTALVLQIIYEDATEENLLTLQLDDVSGLDYLVTKCGLRPVHAAIAVAWSAAKLSWEYSNLSVPDQCAELRTQIRNQNMPIKNLVAALTMSRYIDCSYDKSFKSYRFVHQPEKLFDVAINVCRKRLVTSKAKEYLPSLLACKL